MKSTLSRVSKVAVLSMLVICSLLCKAGESKLTLVGILDSQYLPNIETPEATFEDAAFNIQDKLVTTLHGADLLKGSSSLAKRIRLLIGTLKDGQHKIEKKTASIRGYLQIFATQWAVAILIQDDTIMVVEPYDVSRFEHQVAIVP